MKRIILIFFLLSGCSYNQVDFTNNVSDTNFTDNLSFEEFKTKLVEYAINSPYPNIDN
jgi:hypothetical protein